MWEWLEGIFRPGRMIARLRRRNAYYETVIKDLRSTLAQANAEIEKLKRFISEAVRAEKPAPLLEAHLSELQSRVAALNYEAFKLRKDNLTLEIKLSGALAELKSCRGKQPSR